VMLISLRDEIQGRPRSRAGSVSLSLRMIEVIGDDC